MAVKEKSKWISILFILAGLVIGGLLGNLAGNVKLAKLACLWRRIWIK